MKEADTWRRGGGHADPSFTAGRSLLLNQDARNGAGAGAAVAEARRMYARVMARWAVDMMELRRRGSDGPGGRGGPAVLKLRSEPDSSGRSMGRAA